jgi:predicted acetyltransferase
VSIEIRPITEDEIEEFERVDVVGFGQPPFPAEIERDWGNAELDRTRVAFENGRMVGISRAYSFELTMPGGALVPAAAVSWVSVQPTHRRRGILTQMMGALHDDARDRGEPAAILTASESLIYGRYGYGTATWRCGYSIDRNHATFAQPLDDRGSVQLMTRDELGDTMARIYDDVRRARAGMVSRPSFWWPSVFWFGIAGGKDKAFFVAVHRDERGEPDGYVAYQVDGDWNAGFADRTLIVLDFQTTNDTARQALWQYVFGVDLCAKVVVRSGPIDEPLRWMLRDGRRMRTDWVIDGLWLAPLDAGALLGARTYAVDGQLVVAVHQPDGTTATLAIDGGPDGAKCRATDDDPDLACSTSTLGATLLGGNRWTELAAAGRVDERTPGALTRADLMFTTNPVPTMTSHF